jgi:diguanylate cyclase (GGDEF)-like protein
LTGLTSRRGLDRAFPSLREQAAQNSAPMFALFVDIDGLKAVNDVAGHDVGDTVIDAVAAALRQHCRRNDLVCRWGGDEFVVVGVGDGPDPARLELILADHLAVVNPAPQVWSGRVSVGRTITPAPTAELLALLGAADDDMYARREERRRHQSVHRLEH